jgi:Skp family chaperone for outer membrane proteins
MASRWMIGAAAGLLVVVAAMVARNESQAQGIPVDVSKLAVVDMTRLFNECQQIKDLNDYLQKRDEQLRAKRQSARDAVAQKEAELEAFARGSKEYLERFKQWVQLQIDYGTMVRLQQRQNLREQMHWTRKTYNEIVQAVQEVAKARNLALVLYRDEMDLATDNIQELERRLRGRKVIYAAEPLDITQEILDKINRDYKAGGGLKLPALEQ